MTITVCAAELCLRKLNDLGPDGSNKLDAQSAAHRTGGSLQGVQHHGLDGGVEQPVKRANLTSNSGEPWTLHLGQLRLSQCYWLG